VTSSAALRDSLLLKALPVLTLDGVPICENVPFDIRNKIPVISDFNTALIPTHLAVFEVLKYK
jgi:hypothetical protein